MPQGRDAHPTTTGRPARRAASWSAFLLACAALVGIELLLRRAGGPPAARPADAPAGEFSAERAARSLARVLRGPEGAGGVGGVGGLGSPGSGARPRPIGSVEHSAVLDRLLVELRALGLAPRVEEHLVARGATLARVRNVVVALDDAARDPAALAPGSALLLCAHYDSVAAGPGVGDDGAGVAVLLELARALRAAPAAARVDAPPVLLLFDDGEEAGLLGALGFVEQSAFRHAVGLVLNLEARGTGGASRLFETSPGNAGLIEFYARCAPHPSTSSVSYEVYQRLPNDTDLTVFKAAGYAGLNFAFVGGGRRYHTPLDDEAHLELGTLQQHGANALALVRGLDRAGLAALRRPAGEVRADDAVFADLAGLSVLRYPARHALAFALAPWILALALGALARRRGLWSWGPGLRTLAALCAAPLGAAALAWCADLVVAAAHPGPYPWPAAALAARVLFAALVFAALIAARALAGPGLAAGAWLGACALLQSTAGLALAVWIPGASYVFVVPALVSVLAALALVQSTAGPRAGAVWCSVAAAAQLVLTVPLAQGLEETFEFHTRGTPAIAGLAALGLLAALPLAGVLGGATRRALALAAGLALAAALVALGVVCATPARSPHEPHPIALALVQHAGAGRARLAVRRLGLPAEELGALRPAEIAPQGARASWYARLREFEFVRHIERAPPAALGWELLASSASGERRQLTVALRIPDTRRAAVLQLPEGARLAAVEDGGERSELGWQGPRAVQFLGLRGRTLRLEFDLPREPRTVELLGIAERPSEALEAAARERPAGLEPLGEGLAEVVIQDVEL